MPFFRGVISGVGDPCLFTVSLMPFFRGVISKACFFAGFYRILIKGVST
jgi:hypothetical protein